VQKWRNELRDPALVAKLVTLEHGLSTDITLVYYYP